MVFTASGFMNTQMSHDYGGEQFAIANVVRAVGQPFTIVPLSSSATVMLQLDAGDGWALFNIMRNLGGSVGTALLETTITRREQLHDFHIGSYINSFRPVVADRLNYLTQQFQGRGVNKANATLKAYAAIKQIVLREG
jgi:MFS transporter, DHA2 family, multidrug resistance protein